MTHWLRHHLQAFAWVWKRMSRSPFSSLFNILVIGVALSLPAGLYLLLNNVAEVGAQAGHRPQISVFLALDQGPDQVGTVEKAIKGEPGVGKVQFVPKKDALAQLAAQRNISDIVASLDGNPLPDAFIVNVTTTDADALERLGQSFQQLDGVEHVQLDSAWARRLDAIVALGKQMAFILGLLLGAALVAVTFNTIRLQILTQREEIEVSKLIGATNQYIRRPFLYYGLAQGALGGLAALAILAAGLALLNPSVAELSALYGSQFTLRNLTSSDALALFTLAMALGGLGALLAVQRYLWQIEPR